MLKVALQKLMHKQSIESIELESVLQEIFSGEGNTAQIAAFLALLRLKGETLEEFSTIINTLTAKMIKVPVQCKTLDIVGTGGDGAHTINISTGSAILAASCGVKIAKHGNRAVSSLAGSADVLEALGIRIHLSPKQISRCIEEIGIGFCFSPLFHPIMQQIRAVRKALGIPTTFNLVGPLLNPTTPAHFLVGVFNPDLQLLFANTLQKLGTQRSLVVHSSGLDEICCLGTIQMMEIHDKKIQSYVLEPENLGFNRCQLKDLQGGDAKYNAELLYATFCGKKSTKILAIADTLILNAAITLYLYGLHDSILNAIDHAREYLLNGNALKLLLNWIEFSHDEATES